MQEDERTTLSDDEIVTTTEDGPQSRLGVSDADGDDMDSDGDESDADGDDADS